MLPDNSLVRFWYSRDWHAYTSGSDPTFKVRGQTLAGVTRPRAVAAVYPPSGGAAQEEPGTPRIRRSLSEELSDLRKWNPERIMHNEARLSLHASSSVVYGYRRIGSIREQNRAVTWENEFGDSGIKLNSTEARIACALAWHKRVFPNEHKKEESK